MMPSSGKRFFSIPTTRGISPSGFVASLPSGVLSDGSMLIGVGIERNIGHDAELGKAFFQHSDNTRDQSLGIRRFLAVGGFERRFDVDRCRDRAQHRS